MARIDNYKETVLWIFNLKKLSNENAGPTHVTGVRFELYRFHAAIAN